MRNRDTGWFLFCPLLLIDYRLRYVYNERLETQRHVADGSLIFLRKARQTCQLSRRTRSTLSESVAKFGLMSTTCFSDRRQSPSLTGMTDHPRDLQPRLLLLYPFHFLRPLLLSHLSQPSILSTPTPPIPQHPPTTPPASPMQQNVHHSRGSYSTPDSPW